MQPQRSSGYAYSRQWCTQKPCGEGLLDSPTRSGWETSWARRPARPQAARVQSHPGDLRTERLCGDTELEERPIDLRFVAVCRIGDNAVNAFGVTAEGLAVEERLRVGIADVHSVLPYAFSALAHRLCQAVGHAIEPLRPFQPSDWGRSLAAATTCRTTSWAFGIQTLRYSRLSIDLDRRGADCAQCRRDAQGRSDPVG